MATPGERIFELKTENARLRSALGSARKYIVTHGPVRTNKTALLNKIKSALDKRDKPATV